MIRKVGMLISSPFRNLSSFPPPHLSFSLLLSFVNGGYKTPNIVKITNAGRSVYTSRPTVGLLMISLCSYGV